MVLLAVLAAALVALACHHFRVGPFFALVMWSCMYGFSPFLVFPLVLGTVLLMSAIVVRSFPRRLQIPTVFLAACAVLGGLLISHLRYPRYDEFTPTRQELDETRQWLWKNPPNGHNRRERRKRMGLIQRACDQLSPEVFDEYEDTWFPRAWIKSHGYERFFANVTRTAGEMEARHPSLYYLRQATAHAMKDIRETRVSQGLAVWHLHNMGFVFKTPQACFGIDLHHRQAEELAEDLDFLLVTHVHRDHIWHPLLDEMARLGKPILTREKHRDWPECIVVAQPKEFHFGTIRVRAELGDHVVASSTHQAEAARDAVLMFQVDCGDGAREYTLYHTGDAGNVEKMRPDKAVDVLIMQYGVPVREAVRKLNPRMTFASHVLELGHSPKIFDFGRGPYDFAYRWSIAGIPEDKADVLTWGERWTAPGTVLQAGNEGD